MTDPLAPGATIGILGGGQLGRMLSVAAARLGFKTCIFEPGADCPASHVANYHFKAAYDDEDALRAFAARRMSSPSSSRTSPPPALDLLGTLAPVRPGRRALKASQDRLVEKAFLSDLGLATAPSPPSMTPRTSPRRWPRSARPASSRPAVFGYDGKGQARVDRPPMPGRRLPR